MQVNGKKLTLIIEALLFASDTPLSSAKIKALLELDSTKEITTAIRDLNKWYTKNDRPLTVKEIAGGWQIVTDGDYAPFIQKLYKGRSLSRLTARGLETLAIIAYKQPVTKSSIEEVRGVNCDGVVKTLLERNLITIIGREKAPGNPLLYGTTRQFLEYFGLKNLDALPKLKEIDELLKSDDKFLESLDQVALEQLSPEALGLKNALDKNQSEGGGQTGEKAEEVNPQPPSENLNESESSETEDESEDKDKKKDDTANDETE